LEVVLKFLLRKRIGEFSKHIKRVLTLVRVLNSSIWGKYLPPYQRT